MPPKKRSSKGTLPKLPTSPSVVSHDESSTQKKGRKTLSSNSRYEIPSGETVTTLSPQAMNRLDEKIETFLNRKGPSFERFPAKLPKQVHPSDVNEQYTQNKAKPMSNTAKQRQFWREKTFGKKRKETSKEVHDHDTDIWQGSASDSFYQRSGGEYGISVASGSPTRQQTHGSSAVSEVTRASYEYDEKTDPSQWKRYMKKKDGAIPNEIAEASQGVDRQNFSQFIRSDLPYTNTGSGNGGQKSKFNFATTSLSMIGSGKVPLTGYSGMFGPQFADSLEEDDTDANMPVKFNDNDPFYGAGTAVGYGLGYEHRLKNAPPLAYGQTLAEARIRGDAPMQSPSQLLDGFQEEELTLEKKQFKQEYLQTGEGLKRIKGKSKTAQESKANEKSTGSKLEKKTRRPKSLRDSPLNPKQRGENPATNTKASKTMLTGYGDLMSPEEVDALIERLSTGTHVKKLRKELETSRKKLEETHIELQRQQYSTEHEIFGDY